jgi:hypothetical protein
MRGSSRDQFGVGERSSNARRRAAQAEDVLTFYQAFFAPREVLAPSSSFLNAPFGRFSPEETPALLAYLRKL